LGKTTSEMEAARLASSASATQRSRCAARAIAALRADGCARHDTARTAVYAGASDPGDPDRTAARFALVRYNWRVVASGLLPPRSRKWKKCTKRRSMSNYHEIKRKAKRNAAILWLKAEQAQVHTLRLYVYF
jgi:hypothetical protein